MDNIKEIAHYTIPAEHLEILKSIAKTNARLIITTDKFEWGWLGERKSPVNELINESNDLLIRAC